MTKKTIFIKDTGSHDSNKLDLFFDTFDKKIKENGLEGKTDLVKVSDIGIYNKGIVIKILPQDVTYSDLNEGDITRIIESTLKKDKVLIDLVLDKQPRQVRIALRNCGNIDPENIDEFISRDGYTGLKKALLEMTPEDVIEQMKLSGLRGRGGGGFPTWLKWNITRGVDSEQKYVICNADEGDPGAYMDRSMLEGDPHSLIEGMIIGGYAMNAPQGYFYIRAEYPLAVKRVELALEKAYEYGLLGENILGSGFSFNIEIRLGAGAFVCGEETALIASIEGRRGYPRPRPPYPAIKGLWDMPTVINNVETFANVPYIIANGGNNYASFGADKSRGTKVFAVTGNVKNSGLVEVPMGTTLKEIVFDIGGGTFSGKEAKAIQTGGPSGGVIPKEYFDTPVSYEHLQELGSIMGSGGMIVMDEGDCMVDIAKFYLKFCVDESCGKCAPCRIGGYQMLRILQKISEGKAEIEDLDKLRAISSGMQKASLCGLGQTASNPVVSTLRYFEDEYKDHIINRRCPAGKCSSLLSYKIDEKECKKCGLCVKYCPVEAISGNRESGYKIDSKLCIKCGKCADVCNFDAVMKV